MLQGKRRALHHGAECNALTYCFHYRCSTRAAAALKVLLTVRSDRMALAGPEWQVAALGIDFMPAQRDDARP